VRELIQALVGAVLPDDDHYDDATLLNSPASHAAHATTRVSNTQADHKSGCTYPGTVRVSVFVVDHSFRAAQLLSEPPYSATNAGRLISFDGSDTKIQIGCNIRRLPQLVNIKFSAKADRARRLVPLTIGGLFRLLGQSQALSSP